MNSLAVLIIKYYMTLSNLKNKAVRKLNSLAKQGNILIKKTKQFVEEKIQKQEKSENKPNSFEHFLKLTVIISLCAYLYWRLYFAHIGVDYFLFFFAFEDAPYILYDKGSFHIYSFILILFFAWPYLLNLTNRFVKFTILMGAFAIFCYLSVKVDQLNTIQGILLFLCILISIILYFLFDKNAIYGTFILLGYFFAISAKNDARNALENPMHVTLISKDGNKILDRSEKDRFLLTATSKFYIVYNRRDKTVEKYNRDEIK